jgi:hypothetical protein
MEEIFTLLQENPKAGTIVIALTSGSLGWIFRNIAQLIIENQRFKKEQKTFFWKEKINAAKKATEFYLEYMNFLNLARQQFEAFETGKYGHEELFQNLEKEIQYYTNKLKSFPHFEHHHITLFYEFDDTKALEINARIFKCNQQIFDYVFKDSDSDAEVHRKEQEGRKIAKTLKECYAELFANANDQLRKIRADLNSYL